MKDEMDIAVLTVSDRAAAGTYDDESGPLIVEIIGDRTRWSVTHTGVVPDDRERIAETLLSWCEAGVGLILTTGGTGFAPRDVTPEATKQVVEREAPGIAEALRYESLKVTKHAMLSRGAAGLRGRTLIINLPGSPKAVRESLDILLPVLPHALELAAGESGAEAGHRRV